VIRQLRIISRAFVCALAATSVAPATTVPFFEDFEAYAPGSTIVPNLTLFPQNWSIVASSYSGHALNNFDFEFSSQGVALFGREAASVQLPQIAASAFAESATFRLFLIGNQFE
jgi:hypothetical protein